MADKVIAFREWLTWRNKREKGDKDNLVFSGFDDWEFGDNMKPSGKYS